MAPPGRLGDCRGCRLVCGLGLLGAGGYVFASARRLMRKTGAAPGPGTVGQIVFALGLASWGVVMLVNPETKSPTK
ncbi:distal membrane-arm assembly complex protein 1 isoform X1 [Chiloscyllium plagiosum]|uniref:distal membrane-arm assembly complex protein 1 isoform X1 n=1 Tax=Chiloscyllium plagiosum TaxID=36176 RepID=UPI001CB7EDE5|nr:distal membrane-arm assembly complex protein 1 isoform X1 [Chiloscyllium plagiosum]